MVKLREGTAGFQGPAMHTMMMDQRVLYISVWFEVRMSAWGVGRGVT